MCFGHFDDPNRRHVITTTTVWDEAGKTRTSVIIVERPVECSSCARSARPRIQPLLAWLRLLVLAAALVLRYLFGLGATNWIA